MSNFVSKKYFISEDQFQTTELDEKCNLGIQLYKLYNSIGKWRSLMVIALDCGTGGTEIESRRLHTSFVKSYL